MEEIIDILNLEIAQLELQLSMLEQELISGIDDPQYREKLSLRRVELQRQLADLIKQKQLLDPKRNMGWPLHHTNSWLVL
jgi:hypothetical protein